MSHQYLTSTYAADADQVPAALDSPDQVRALATAAFSHQASAPGKLVCVRGATRSGWAIYTAKALVEAIDLPSLGFLSGKGQYAFETEDRSTAVTVLDAAALPGAIADLRRLLGRVREDPMLAMEADSAGNLFGVEDVALAIARDYVSAKPATDYGHVRGDEGEGADYLFTWLRSVLRVMELAHADGRAVIHELRI
jgi:hypothetical protein